MSESDTARIVVRLEPARILIGPHGTMLRAREFFEAGLYLQNNADRFSPVGGFLTCRAIELALKAYLFARDISRRHVRRLGHDLTRLFIEAEVRGLAHYVQFAPGDIAVVIQTGRDYSEHRLAYFDVAWVVGGGFEPSPAILERVATALLAALEPVCRDAAMGDGDPLPLR